MDPIQEGEKIAEKHNPNGLVPFPFDKLKESSSDLDILFSNSMPEGVSGAIFFDNAKSKFIVLINKQKPETRQYFTLAHEIGHYYLHKEVIKGNELLVDEESTLDGSATMLYRDDKSFSTEIEIDANRFAASLIMPEKFVRKAFDELNSVEKCAKVFKVSVVAMSIRLERLGLLH